MKTGGVEVDATEIDILNKSKYHLLKSKMMVNRTAEQTRLVHFTIIDLRLNLIKRR